MLYTTFFIYFLLLLKSLSIGVLTVLTPFIYAVSPITAGVLSPRSISKEQGIKNRLIYVSSVTLIFTLLGLLIAVVINISGLGKFTGHWLFNFIMFRLFVGLGLIFIGAFDIKLPAKWTDPTATKAKTDTPVGIFFMALTLPIVAFSSLMPMLVIVLLFTSDVGFGGPIVSLFGFAVGICAPILYPSLLKIFVSSKVFLNQIKVILGFISILIGMKFFSLADIALGWHILSRDMFIILVMLVCGIVGLYMIGFIRFPKDYSPHLNRYGEKYVSLATFFIAIALFTFVIYLIPGLFGAPLKGISGFLPPA